jgi:hypothetical protein
MNYTAYAKLAIIIQSKFFDPSSKKKENQQTNHAKVIKYIIA